MVEGSTYKDFFSENFDFEADTLFGDMFEKDLSAAHITEDPLIKNFAVANHFLDYNMSKRGTRFMLRLKLFFKSIFKTKEKPAKHAVESTEPVKEAPVPKSAIRRVGKPKVKRSAEVDQIKQDLQALFSASPMPAEVKQEIAVEAINRSVKEVKLATKVRKAPKRAVKVSKVKVAAKKAKVATKKSKRKH